MQKHISEEKLREIFGSVLLWEQTTKDLIKLREKIFNECQVINPWLSVEEFEKEPNEGWCWVAYKGRVVEAYHDHEGSYRFHRLSSNCYLRECINAVMPFDRPVWENTL